MYMYIWMLIWFFLIISTLACHFHQPYHQFPIWTFFVVIFKVYRLFTSSFSLPRPLLVFNLLSSSTILGGLCMIVHFMFVFICGLKVVTWYVGSLWLHVIYVDGVYYGHESSLYHFILEIMCYITSRYLIVDGYVIGWHIIYFTWATLYFMCWLLIPCGRHLFLWAWYDAWVD